MDRLGVPLLFGPLSNPIMFDMTDDVRGLVISFYEHARDEGWITNDEYERKKTEIILAGKRQKRKAFLCRYVGIPVIIIGTIVWIYVVTV
jgi:hypothetical protein